MTTSYRDIGALQRPKTGSPTAKTSYVDIGAAQTQQSAAGGGATTLPSLLLRNQMRHALVR